MAGAISGLGTTYGLPNYTGELFSLTPADTAFLSAIGGLSGGGLQTQSTEFEWETYDLRAPVTNNVQLEGQDAPTGVGRVRGNVTNVVEIHQSSINISYTKLAAIGLKNGSNNALPNPITDEFSWQVQQELKAIARDVNASFLNGTYQKPSDNTTARKTRGLIPAITTNVQTVLGASGATIPAWTSATNGTITSTAHGLVNGNTFVPLTLVTTPELTVGQSYYVTNVTTNTFTVSNTKGGSTITFAATGSGTGYKAQRLTETMILDTVQSVWDNGGITVQDTATIVCGSSQKRELTYQFVTNKNYREMTRNMGGVDVQVIETDFGRLNILLDRQMPKGSVLIASLDHVQPVFLETPGKGHLFVEPLAKTGAQEKAQIYGEMGLKYGAELYHGYISGLALGGS